MASSDQDHPDTEVPEADRLEQEQSADPGPGADQPVPHPPPWEADEADELEQAQEVPTDPDEEYPPDSS